MSEITIPPEALEAAAKEIAMQCRCAMACDWRDHMGDARAACLAMLDAWPGMHIHEWHRPWLGGMSGTDIILPLTENSNAE